MARRRSPIQDDEGDPEFQISTMCDILMSLLVFFVATIDTEMSSKAAELELPEVHKAQEPEERQGELVVNVTLDGVLVNTRFYPTPDEIIPVIQKEKEAAQVLYGEGSNFRVLIRADKGLTFGAIYDVMKACGTAGVVDTAFGTTSGPES